MKTRRIYFGLGWFIRANCGRTKSNNRRAHGLRLSSSYTRYSDRWRFLQNVVVQLGRGVANNNRRKTIAAKNIRSFSVHSCGPIVFIRFPKWSKYVRVNVRRANIIRPDLSSSNKLPRCRCNHFRSAVTNMTTLISCMTYEFAIAGEWVNALETRISISKRQEELFSSYIFSIYVSRKFRTKTNGCKLWLFLEKRKLRS